MEKLPREVMYNILLRLPLKYVIQCVCVCKSWLSIVRDPAFKELHFSQSESEPSILILTHHVIGENKMAIGISYMKQEAVRLELVPGDTAIANIISSRSWSLVGTCHGLLCLASSSSEIDIMVCNPITREHVLLPKSTPCPTSYRAMLAFGFDLIAKEYKVVRLVCPPPDQRPEIAAEVYTLGDTGTGSWRRSVQGFNCALPRGRPVYASGAVHWLVHPHPVNPPHPHHHYHHPYMQHLHGHQQINHPGETILSFDLGKEVFEIVPHIRFGRESSLEELGKCVAVVDTSSTTLVEVSVLRDASENRWQKEYILPVRKPRLRDRESPRLICALERSDGALLLWLQDSLLTYKRKGFLRRDLKLARFPTWLDWEICSGYRGSLVSLSHFNTANEEENDVSFVGDQELYAIASKNIVVGGREAARRCDNIVNCFHENGMMLD